MGLKQSCPEYPAPVVCNTAPTTSYTPTSSSNPKPLNLIKSITTAHLRKSYAFGMWGA